MAKDTKSKGKKGGKKFPNLSELIQTLAGDVPKESLIGAIEAAAAAAIAKLKEMPESPASAGDAERKDKPKKKARKKAKKKMQESAGPAPEESPDTGA